jgi:HlyD family secretion protein
VKPARGEIRLNGRAIVTEDDVRRLHACLAYVAQATFIADDTLLANIVLDARHRGVDQARLARALRIAQLDGLVAELPDGLETRVGERGARLSGGQTQRIGIARALYLDRPVLILDEATSALDPATENRFVAALNHELAGRTLLVISHRPAALAGCAEIRRIAAGRLSAPIPYDEVVGAPPEPEPRSS